MEDLGEPQRLESITKCTHCHYLDEECTHTLTTNIREDVSKCDKCLVNMRLCSFDTFEKDYALVMFARFSPEGGFRMAQNQTPDYNPFSQGLPVRAPIDTGFLSLLNTMQMMYHIPSCAVCIASEKTCVGWWGQKCTTCTETSSSCNLKFECTSFIIIKRCMDLKTVLVVPFEYRHMMDVDGWRRAAREFYSNKETRNLWLSREDSLIQATRSGSRHKTIAMIAQNEGWTSYMPPPPPREEIFTDDSSSSDEEIGSPITVPAPIMAPSPSQEHIKFANESAGQLRRQLEVAITYTSNSEHVAKLREAGRLMSQVESVLEDMIALNVNSDM